MVRMALKLWKLTLEPYQSFSENNAAGPAYPVLLYYIISCSAIDASRGDLERTTVCVLYRKPFSLLELGYLIIINLLRSVDHT